MVVECINNTDVEDELTVGKKYHVIYSDLFYFMVINDKNNTMPYNRNIFREIVEEEQSKYDNVNHPKHYTQGIECWDYIKSHNMDFLQGSAIKYITRYKQKNGAEDLHKAIAFIQKILKEEYGEE